MPKKIKQNMTINDLAVMVASGFEHVEGRMDKFEGRMDKFEGRMDKIEHQMQALNSNVNNYLELSERRYAELKQRDVLLAKWIKLVANKTGVPVDLSQLEKI